MQKLFNSKIMKFRRRELRNNMTRAEILLWMRLKGSVMGCKFRRQHSIGSFVVDFYCPQHKLVIEVDGGIHLTKPVKKYDELRQGIIESLGLHFLRFTNDDIFVRLEWVIARIRETLPTERLPVDPQNLSLPEGE